MIGMMSFKCREGLPLLFYVLSTGFAFIIHTLSLILIEKLSASAKLKTVVGVSAMGGSYMTYATVFSVFTALVTMSGLSLRFSINHTYSFIGNSSLLNILLYFAYGSVFFIAIKYIPQRKKLYFWSKLLLGLSLFIIASIISGYDFRKIRDFMSESNEIEINLDTFKEFLTIQAIVLGSLFSERICDDSILKPSGNTLKESESSKLFPLLTSNSISFLIYTIFIFLNNTTTFCDNEIRVTKFLWILVIISSFIQSFEFFDSSHNLIYGFFKPVFQESVKSLEEKGPRDIWLTLLVLSVAYFIRSSTGIYSAMIYSFSLMLSLPFLIFPVICLIQQLRKKTIGFEVLLLTSGILCGITGIILFTSIVFGFHSLQIDCIQTRMMQYVIHGLIAMLLSSLIYIILMLLDIYFYPPKVPSPMNHRTFAGIETFKYGNNYMTETIIVIFGFLSLLNHSHPISPSLISQNVFLQVLYLIPKAFILGLPFELLIESLIFYRFGKRLSNEIGPFHLLAFFLVSSIFSYMLADIVESHLGTYEYLYLVNHYYCLWGGAYGPIAAILAKYFMDADIGFNVYGLSLTGHEYGIYIILLAILFRSIGFRILDLEFSGICFGFFTWNLSIRIWKLRDELHKRLSKS